MFTLLLILPVNALFLLLIGLCTQDVQRELLGPYLIPKGDQLPEQPLISVLIPARDEAARIGPCLNGLAQQQYHAFEVIVVDDHSIDGTADVALRYADSVPRLDIVASAPLPEGWVGKCWACWQAAGQARGEWLLFLDADVAPQPQLLNTLIHRTQTSGADFITLMPLLQMGSLAECTLLPTFHSILYALYPLAVVSDPNSPLSFANGQCIFIHRTVYEATGGHSAVRASVLEDTDFGQRVKSMGYRLEAARAPELLNVRMYTDWTSVVEGLGKNAVAGYRSGGARSAWVGLRQALLAFAPLSLLIIGALVWGASPSVYAIVLMLHGAVLALVIFATTAWIIRKRYRIFPFWALLYPLGLAIYFGLATTALVRLRTRRGVRWKGRVIKGEP
jgi:glycosyltransferase involved in cell wall biosynthesis